MPDRHHHVQRFLREYGYQRVELRRLRHYLPQQPILRQRDLCLVCGVELQLVHIYWGGPLLCEYFNRPEQLWWLRQQMFPPQTLCRRIVYLMVSGNSKFRTIEELGETPQQVTEHD